MTRNVTKISSLLIIGLMSSAGLGADAARASKKLVRHDSPKDKIIVEPRAVAVDSVDALKAGALGEVAVTWSDKGVAQALYGPMGDYGGATEEAARRFLSSHAGAFKMQADVADLTLVADRETPGGRVIDFEQRYEGLKVFGGGASVGFDRQGNVTVTSATYLDASGLRSTTPQVDAAEARGTLLASVKRADTVDASVNELVVYVDEADVAHLAHHIVQPTRDRHGAGETYEAFVDAASGEIIGAPRDINQYATGKVYGNGNAMAATGNSSLKDASAIPSTAYQTVTILGLTSSSGLVGQYADTHTNTASANRATPDASGNYTYTRSTTVSTGSKFDAVNTYFYVDDAQRYIQSLGFTNVNNRSVKFQINGTTDDNSWYTPNSSGTGALTTGSGGVDDAEDAEVMLHEYGHSIQDNQRPGAWGGAQPGAMGEGWGDYWAASLTGQRHGQRGTAYETTVMEWDASSYSSAVPPTIRSITSTKHYPESVQNEVHADGEMWSSTLWQIRSDFISQDGWPLGAQNADKVVLQSHFLVPSSGPSYADGSNALIQAATNLGFNQAHVDAVRNRCAGRGFISGGTPPPPGAELVANGGFESGATGWTFATYSSVTAGSAQSGSNKAQQLGRGTTTTTSFYQGISGFNGTAKTLKFYLKMASGESTSTAYDKLYVRITNGSGATVSTLSTITNVNKNTYTNWALVTLTVPSSAAVSGNRITFYATEDSSLATTFYVDGVSIQ